MKLGTKTHEDTIMKDLNQMKKEDLVVLVQELECCLDIMESRVKAGKIKQPGRKDEVLQILTNHGHVAVHDIAKQLGITARNVSSQLSYLRKDGYAIATDSRGKKFLEI